MNSERRFQAAIAAICVLALALRLYGLPWGPINLDEGYTILAAKMGLLAPFKNGPCDWNPPGASLTYSLWMLLFGPSRIAVELLAVIFGVGSILLVALLTKQMFGNRMALAAAFLCAISKYHVLFSQFARIYSFALFALLLALLVLLRYRTHPSKIMAALFVGVSFVAMNLHYYAAIALLSGLLSVCFAYRDDKRFLRFAIGSGVVLGIVYLPNIIWQAHVIRHVHERSWIEPFNIAALGSIFFHFSSESIVLLVLFFSLFLFGLRHGLSRREKRPRTVLLVSWIFLPIIVSTVFSITGGSILHVRYFIFCLPPFLMLVASGWALLPNQSVRRFLACVMVLASAISLQGYYHEAYALKQEEEIFQKIEKEYQPGDAVLHTSRCSFVSSVYAHEFAYAEYLLAEAVSGVLRCTLGESGKEKVNTPAALSRLWVVDTDCYPHRAGAAQRFLPPLEHATKFSFSNGTLYLFEQPPTEVLSLGLARSVVYSTRNTGTLNMAP